MPVHEGPGGQKLIALYDEPEKWPQYSKTYKEEKFDGINLFSPISPEYAELIEHSVQPKMVKVSSISDVKKGWKHLKGLKSCQAFCLPAMESLDAPIDLTWFPNLTTYFGNIWPNLKNIKQTKLVSCDISFCKHIKSFVDYQLPETVEELLIQNSLLKSLNGIEKLTRLKSLDLANLRSIRDLSILASLPNLRVLRLALMPGIQNASFPKLQQLERLEIINSKIDSVSFLRDFGALKYLNLGTTKIEDCDASSIDLNKPWDYFYIHRPANRWF
jgi:hypothetical protein